MLLFKACNQERFEQVLFNGSIFTSSVDVGCTVFLVDVCNLHQIHIILFTILFGPLILPNCFTVYARYNISVGSWVISSEVHFLNEVSEGGFKNLFIFKECLVSITAHCKVCHLCTTTVLNFTFYIYEMLSLMSYLL